MATAVAAGVVFLAVYFTNWNTGLIRGYYQSWSTSASGFQTTFEVTYYLLGAILALTAFQPLREKEKSFGFWMLSTSVGEKFLFEYLVRVVLFVALFPILYWVVFHLECLFHTLISPNYKFQAYSFVQATNEAWRFEDFDTLDFIGGLWIKAMAMSPFFLGAVFFKSYPIIKTPFALVILWMILFGMMYSAVFQFGINTYELEGLWLMPDDDKPKMGYFYLWVTIPGITMLAAAFFKFKEKEV
jgi:hypothetical protein